MVLGSIVGENFGIARVRSLTAEDQRCEARAAQDLGMHESTISRVTSNKYIETNRGIFESLIRYLLGS